MHKPLIAFLAVATLGGCGLKGDLYLEKPSAGDTNEAVADEVTPEAPAPQAPAADSNRAGGSPAE